MSGNPFHLTEYRVDRAQAVRGPAHAFHGEVYVQPLHQSDPDAPSIDVHAVHFSRGARTRPHTHAHDQLLFMLEGTGFVHTAGGEEQRLEPGTIVVIPAGVPHMHGATDASAIVHVAMRPSGSNSIPVRDGLPAGWEKYVEAL